MSRSEMRPPGEAARAAPTVDLVFDADCPNVDEARAILRTALTAAGLRSEWREWRRDAAETPLRLRRFGSPTILVEGADVSGADEHGGAVAEHGSCCRLYPDEGRLRGVPPLVLVTAALTRGSRAR